MESPATPLVLGTKEEAIAKVRSLEFNLAKVLRGVHPEELVPLLTRRARDPQFSPAPNVPYSPCVLAHAVEACCAHWKPWQFETLAETKLAAVLHAATACCIDDPAMAAGIKVDSNLLEFAIYMHRTQFEKQGHSWWMSVGRCAHLFAQPNIAPRCDEALRQSCGVGLSDWFALSVAISGGIQKDGLFLFQYVNEATKLGVSREASQSFFDAVSASPSEIGQQYHAVRATSGSSAAPSPLLWMQSRPVMSDRPLVRLARGYAAPLDSYAADLFGEILVRRLVAADDPGVNAEFGKRYFEYVNDCLGHLFPSNRRWKGAELEGPEKSADFVVEFNEFFLIIECKATAFNARYATPKSLLETTAFGEAIGGLEQVLTTAERIVTNGYSEIGLVAGKPLYGVVAVMGELPAANHPAAREHALKVIGPKCAEMSKHLAAPTQVLDEYSLEALLLAEASGRSSIPALFAEHGSTLAVGISGWRRVLAPLLTRLDRKYKQFWIDSRDKAMPILKQV